MTKKKETNKILLTAVFMMFATLMSKVLGLVRDSLIAAFFGTGMTADAFMTASRAPTTLFDMVIGGVISATFIPMFNTVRSRQGEKEATTFVNKFVTMILLASVIISVLGMIFSGTVVEFLAPNYTGDKFDMTVTLTRIMFPMIIFTGLAFSYVGYLQSMGEYNIPSIISLVSNAAIILYFVFFGKKYGVTGLAYTMVAAWSLQVIVQIPSLIKFKYKFRLDFRLKDKNITDALKLAGPMLISTWVQPLYSVVNSRLASGIDGAVSTLDYANRLYIIVTGVCSFVVTNLIFPKLARANADDDKKQARELIMSSLKAITIVVLPLMTGFILLSEPITRIIYMRGETTARAASAISGALACYSVGMFGLAVNEVLSKYFFSISDSKTPMRNSILSMVFNIVLAYVFFGMFKIKGLALAAAGGSIFNALLNGVCFVKLHPQIVSKKSLVTFLRVALSALIMGVCVFIAYKFVYRNGDTLNCIITCAVCGVIGAIVYAASAYISGIEDVRRLLNRREK